jgi:hypothetical protein
MKNNTHRKDIRVFSLHIENQKALSLFFFSMKKIMYYSKADVFVSLLVSWDISTLVFCDATICNIVYRALSDAEVSFTMAILIILMMNFKINLKKIINI